MSRRRINMAALLMRTRLCFIVVSCVLISCRNVESNNISCMDFQQKFSVKDLEYKNIPQGGIPGSGLILCPSTVTCCSNNVENSLKSLSQKQFEKQLDDTLILIRSAFSSGTLNFDKFLSSLLEDSKRQLHVMFVKTYGLLYKKNSEIFEKFFVDLESYYSGRHASLGKLLDAFFKSLLKRMFQLLNVNKSFNERYLDCVVRYMHQLKPFGDVPEKMTKQVTRAFVAARTFVQGLAIGREVIKAVSQIPPSYDCVAGLMKMLYCPQCRGLMDTKPCSNFCLNTMKGCLAYQSELNSVWNEYIGALVKVAGRLQGPFNLENVVLPICLQISDAIMNFQNNGPKVSERILKGCGPASANTRQKREASPNTGGKTSYEQLAFGSNWNKQSGGGNKGAKKSLDNLVRNIKTKIETSIDYWKQLPYSVCNNEVMSSKLNDESNCWNGHEKARYNADVQKDGFANQFLNPEVKVRSRNNPIVIRQITRLKIITGKLQKAYNGIDVEWVEIDTRGKDDEDIEVSGSGSGDDPEEAIDEGSGGSGDDVDEGSGDQTEPTRNRGKGHRRKPHRKVYVTRRKHNRKKNRGQKKGPDRPKTNYEDDRNSGIYLIPPSSSYRPYVPTAAARISPVSLLTFVIVISVSLSWWW